MVRRFGATALIALAGGAIAMVPIHAARAPARPDAAILAASRTTPVAFVRALLRTYASNTTPTDRLPDLHAFFSRPTIALIARVERKNQEGAFDADPFCDCQDWTALKVAAVKITPADATHVAATVTMIGDSALTQRYLLVKEPAGWRVDDIVHRSNGSLVKALRSR